jgi:hypothetical protein
MHIAIGYRWSATCAGNHIERALRALNHQVTYVGMPCAHRPGYDSSVPVNDILETLPERPDLYLLIDPIGRYFPPGIEDLPIPTVCYLIDVHLGSWRQQAARFFDGVFIAQKDYLGAFQSAVGHDQVYWLPLAASPDVHRRLDLPAIYDVGFVGNVALAHSATSRSRRLELLSERFNTNDFYRRYLPQEVGEIYSQSRLVFNTSIAGDVTMRVFEGTACGAMLLTDTVSNGLAELFDIGREIVVYENDTDLLENVSYYLAHEDERSQIAQAGYERTQAEHTYLHRMETMLRVVSGGSFASVAPMRVAGAAERWAARRIAYTHLHMLDQILDDTRAAEFSPLHRAWAAMPCLVRRLFV